MYTSGEFAKKARVTIRTIRYYDKRGILKPSAISEGGYRLYTDEDFAKLQKILSLKYLGFSLEEITDMTVNDSADNLKDSLELQLGLIDERIAHLQAMKSALKDAKSMAEHSLEHSPNRQDETGGIDWNQILNLIHLTNMEHVLVEQYKNSANLNIRISLHRDYSVNRQGWFPWLFEQIAWKGADEGAAGAEAGTEEVLELGCGNGEIWKNLPKLQNQSHSQSQSKPLGTLQHRPTIYLTDKSEGMVRDSKKNLTNITNATFRTAVFDCQQIPYPDRHFQTIIANHVLFYAKSPDRALEEVRRVLTEDGTFYCSTYGSSHMKEVTALAQEFDSRIRLTEVELFKVFGLENGEEILKKYFGSVEKRIYEDALEVTEAEPLLEYILSCHGNQSEILANRREEFKEFLAEKIKKNQSIHITKMAGVFLCQIAKNDKK